MRTLIDHLSTYASYHQNERNVLTHFFGIPLIVIAIFSLLSTPWQFELASGSIGISLTHLVIIGTSWFYWRLDKQLGILMLLFSLVCYSLAMPLMALSTFGWLASSVALFVLGWVLQFVGHYFEGRKPAFVDDLVGLVIGPLFIVCEWAFRLGFFKQLQAQLAAKKA